MRLLGGTFWEKFNEGTFRGGTFRGGTFRGGTFREGTFTGGTILQPLYQPHLDWVDQQSSWHR